VKPGRREAREGLLDGIELLKDAEDGDDKATAVAGLIVGSLIHVADRIADLTVEVHDLVAIQRARR
jgi:hypothetical protein